MEKVNRKIRSNGIVATLVNAGLCMYAISLTYLYYHQAVTETPQFESDLPAHIRMGVVEGWNYSLTAVLYRFFYRNGAEHGAVMTALFLMGMSMAAVLLTAVLLREIRGYKEDRKLPLTMGDLGLGILFQIVMPCFVPGIADGRYIGMQSASIWHNSTYIVMKPLGLLCILLYLKIQKKIREGIDPKLWAAFCGSLILTTAVKPSFLVVFAPAMLVFLIVDLMGKVPLGRLFLFGCAVLPSLWVVWLQNVVLFGQETGNSFVFAPGEALRLHSAHPIIASGLSILFPLWILFWMIVTLIRKKEAPVSRTLLFFWCMALVGYAELACFSEAGGRALDGNFSWGYAFAILPIFLEAYVWFEKALTEVRKKKTDMLQTCAVALGGIFLFWHLYCGGLFFVRLLQGVSYFMWD